MLRPLISSRLALMRAVTTIPSSVTSNPSVAASSFRRLLSTTTKFNRVLPPNLKIHPRSTFAVKPAKRSFKGEVEDADADDVEEAHNDEEEDDDDDSSVADASDSDSEDDKDYTRVLAEQEIQYAVPLPERLNVQVHTLFAPSHASQTGTLWLEQNVFGRDPIRIDLLKRAVDYYRAKKRGRRKAKTKTIGELSGSGRKVRPQKGSGRARAGHSRPAHWKGGAKAHGPKNTTDYGNTKLNKKVRKQALCHALSQKLLEGNVIVLNSLFDLPTHKTKDLARLLEPWGIGGRHGTTALILDSYYVNKKEGEEKAGRVEEQPASFRGVPANLVVASSNIHNVKVGNDHDGSVYDLLKHEKLVLTLGALEKLESRLKNV